MSEEYRDYSIRRIVSRVHTSASSNHSIKTRMCTVIRISMFKNVTNDHDT
jgi:hypothetical protein